MPVDQGLLTFEEFVLLPDPPAGRHELRHGEVVLVPPPKSPHWSIQAQVADLLNNALRKQGRAGSEFPFRALPEGEYRIADVAFVVRERWVARTGDYFEGAPDLVVEVLSPSNTASEMLDREIICLENGARAFWQVDPATRRVKVTLADGRTATYGPGSEIPLDLFDAAPIRVDDIFAE